MYEDALRDLLSVWLFEAYKPQSWQNEEERLRWLSFGYLRRTAGEARSDQDLEGIQGSTFRG